jgi:hypothetical protein
LTYKLGGNMPLVKLYVDVENLRDMARQLITTTIEEWPANFPKPNILQLYVSADQTHIWEIWAGHKFPSLELNINGVQRYSLATKNSADMSLMLSAFADISKNRATHVAILSDDSDYIALFTAMTKEIPRDDKNMIPFIWFITDRPDTHSRILDDFIPSQYLHFIKCKNDKKPVDEIVKSKIVVRNRQPTITIDKATSNDQEINKIVEAIIQDVPVGPFRSTDCIKIVKKHFPSSPLSLANTATFGNQFAKNIWPLLEKRGARLPNPDKKPRKYEMTGEAKTNIKII